MVMKSRLLLSSLAAVAAVLSTGATAADGKGAIYGDIRFGLDYSDSQGPNSTASGVAEDTDMVELNSFTGVKASVTQGSCTAFGAWELYLDPILAGNLAGTRQVYAGLQSPIGTVSYGRMFTEYANTGRALDPFRDTTLARSTGGQTPTFLVSYGLSPLLTGEFPFTPVAGIQANQIAYTTPSLGGVTVNGAIFLDEADNGPTAGQESHDYALGAGFNMSGISAGVQYLQINDDVGAGTFAGLGGTDGHALRLHGGFNQKSFGVSLSAEVVNDEETAANDQEYLFLAGWVGLGQATRVAVSVGQTNETAFEGTGVQVGVFHDVVENLTVHLGTSRYDLEDNSVSGPGGVDDAYAVALGASYKFNLGAGN